jgi:hypothetical protein
VIGSGSLPISLLVEMVDECIETELRKAGDQESAFTF